MKGQGMVLALMAGMMAALGSVSAKLAMSADAVGRLCNEVLTGTEVMSDSGIDVFCQSISTVLRLVCFCGIFLFNALMWTFYTKSLQFCTSTVEATVINTSANFLFSALFGFALFQEHLPLLWWVGSCLILAGLVFIHRGNVAAEQKQAKKES